MGITVYSVVISVVFFNIALAAAFIMRRSGAYLARYTVTFLMLTVLLGIARLLTPIDFDTALVVRSYQFLPRLRVFLSRTVAGRCTVGTLLLLLWLAGTLVFVLRDVTRMLRFLRVSRGYPPSDRMDLVELAAEYGHNFGLLVSVSVSRPYVSGLFRPVIYLPDIELSEAQWRTILRHEIQHIRSHDEWKKLFFLVIQALFWWNPLAHISRREIDTLIELQCDASVTAGMSEGEVDTYLDTMYVLMARARDRRLAATASTMVWDARQMEARFLALRDAGITRKNSPHTALYFLLFAAFAASYFVIVQPYEIAHADGLVDDLQQSDTYEVYESIANSSEMYIVLEGGEYYLYVNGVAAGIINEENLSVPPFNTLPILEENK